MHSGPGGQSFSIETTRVEKSRSCIFIAKLIWPMESGRFLVVWGFGFVGVYVFSVGVVQTYGPAQSLYTSSVPLVASAREAHDKPSGPIRRLFGFLAQRTSSSAVATSSRPASSAAAGAQTGRQWGVSACRPS